MIFGRRAVRRGAAGLIMAIGTALGGCAGNSTLGNVLGSVLGTGSGSGSNQVQGAVTGVDTRSQQVGIQMSNGQTVALSYDNQTQVVYQNQNYAVTNLERGDQVVARVQQSNNGGYYTDLIQVTQSVSSNSGTTASGNVQSYAGTVRQIDRTNGWFSMTDANGYSMTVSMPYRVSSADLNRFQSLRTGDYVRLYGVPLNNTRVELRQFY